MSWTTPPVWAPGELVTATLLNELSEDLSYLLSNGPAAEIAQVSAATDKSIASSSDTLVVDLGSLTYTTQPILLEAWGLVYTGGGFAIGDLALLSFYDGSTNLGLQWQQKTYQNSAAEYLPFNIRIRLTPTAGSHDYGLKGSRTGSASGWVVKAGAGLRAIYA